MTTPVGQSARYEIQSCPDIEFGRPDGHVLRLDLSLPIGVAAPAVVLYLHGGGWMIGSRKSHAARAERLARHGFAVASIDYRPSTVAPFPAQILDIVTAIEWLKGPGQAFGVDANRVALWGASAGAHLALLATAAPAIRRAPHDVPGPPVQAAVGYFGCYDLTSRGDLDRPDTGSPIPREILEQDWPSGVPAPPSSRYLRARLLGGDESAVSDRELAAISPFAKAHDIHVPVFLLHGTRDSVTSMEQSLRMAQELRHRGETVRLRLLEGANHEDSAFDTDATIADVAAFLHEHLGRPCHTPPLPHNAVQQGD
ncbi:MULTISPECIES: alpha/beta hydrolase [Rhodococcus]|uniref:Esterase n=1 Tax=Rhodococcus opacus RKJ300 = JCM 13270 TaxID=1165867 RepID=I0WAM3_RHOOP|nr:MULTISPECIES: alpha/beta hydrolase [Rhodococcus]EID73439.1 esterase [Rhodococcus opacus RKJ300 = JCM 13270]QQZ12998.1 alpha/beta hydrolase [Rhodococcus sp. 21391]